MTAPNPSALAVQMLKGSMVPQLVERVLLRLREALAQAGFEVGAGSELSFSERSGEVSAVRLAPVTDLASGYTAQLKLRLSASFYDHTNGNCSLVAMVDGAPATAQKSRFPLMNTLVMQPLMQSVVRHSKYPPRACRDAAVQGLAQLCDNLADPELEQELALMGSLLSDSLAP